ncbi:hypothetical protein TNCV_2068651 [Trichonephila clavipes]|uniref:Uncharacterized protein n=1 Tax=Trichonephila clavipes TaxID=2585209 RepID=A0A8X7BE30_TRICX|nr:hypothetical protein TNCV_2068651 [Trichonephila clavipes]
MDWNTLQDFLGLVRSAAHYSAIVDDKPFTLTSLVKMWTPQFPEINNSPRNSLIKQTGFENIAFPVRENCISVTFSVAVANVTCLKILVVKVSDHGWHVTSSSPVLKTRRVGEAMHVKSVENSMSSRWCSVVVRRGGASSGVVLIT